PPPQAPPATTVISKPVYENTSAPVHLQPISSAETDDDEEQFDIVKYIGIIIRRRNVVILITILMTLFSVYRFFTADKYYVTNARLLFRPDKQNIMDEGNSYQSGILRDKLFTTHLELLRSNTVLKLVSENLESKISVAEIAKNITIKQGLTQGNKNDIIELSFRHANPVMARDALNELCRSYIEYRRDVNAQELNRLIFKFETQINKLQAELDSKESDLRLFKEDNRMLQLSNEANITVTSLINMELALQQTQIALIENKERITALSTQINTQEQDIVQSITYQDPFKNRLSSLELELNTLSAEYSPEHYKVKMVKQQIEQIKSSIVDSMSREAASRTFIKNPIREALIHEYINITIEKAALETKRTAQEQIIEKLNKDLARLPSLEQKYAYLQRETESQLQTLRLLKTKFEETKIKRDSQESDLKFLEMAETPQIAISSQKPTSVIIGILIGVILGITLAFILEYLDQSLKEPSDVEKQLELPLIGVVPHIEEDRARIEQLTDITKTILEPFRALRTNLKHVASANEIKTFIICSAVKGEGKTTLSANLAITFSLDGKKVILIDADLHRSKMHSLFSVAKETGLSDYLLGTATVKDVLKPTQYPNLKIVTSGERPLNPAELLGTIRFDQFVNEVRDEADFIFFDSPALLPVSDTLNMAPKMDGCIMVVRALWTPLEAAKQAKHQIKRIGSKIYGCILNGVSHSKGYYPYYYGYYGYYSYKYTYTEDTKPAKFSVREFGLKFENRIKNSLKQLKFSIPKNAAEISSMIRYLFSRWFFWILLIILLSLSGINIWLQSNRKEPVDGIKYIGITNSNSQVPADTSESYIDMALSTSVFSNSTTALPCLNQSITDSIATWLNSRTEGNIQRYISFYDTSRFQQSSEDYKRWKKEISNLFSSGKISLSPVSTRAMQETDTSGEYMTEYIETNSTGTVKHSVMTEWRKSSSLWRIVREKYF
ncbi:MAG: polysaccharide biosynthesis tyrosine autokinase, partial [Fibrobacter sp.]|nr:polysaccharide biosynthesis tyrosine autokinase [Fibrobacter sp.]